MILIVAKDELQAVWNDDTQQFQGDKKLVEYIIKLLAFNARLGSNKYNMLVQDAELYALNIVQYKSDETPKDTYDV